jgi:FKBP-type peptidyl-prolyl cis-trans isomerase
MILDLPGPPFTIERIPMRFKSLAVASIVLSVAVLAAQEPPLGTEDERMLYTLGMALSRRLNEYALTPAEAELVRRGLMDGLLGKKEAVDFAAEAERMDDYFGERVRKIAERQRSAGEVFRERKGKQRGAVTTGTGLVFLDVEEGDGARPTGADTVRVKLTGTLPGGEVFLGETEDPVELALALPCVREGLLRMKTGGRAQLVCPPELAYGNRGVPPHVLPGDTVVYEVELLAIDKATP